MLLISAACADKSLGGDASYKYWQTRFIRVTLRYNVEHVSGFGVWFHAWKRSLHCQKMTAIRDGEEGGKKKSKADHLVMKAEFSQ